MESLADPDRAASIPAGEGEGGSPLLQLDGFHGPLAVLLALARSRQIALARLPVGALVDQLVAAVQQADPRIPLSQKGDWLVMASWLLLLRSRLLLPAEAPAQHEARNEAENLRERLRDLQAAQALAAWLEHRPQLGRDVFPRGLPEQSGTVAATQYEVDVIEFLWACLAQFDDGLPRADRRAVYRPPWHDLCSVLDARAHILRLLAEMPEEAPLGRFLPRVRVEDDRPDRWPLWRRSAVASTLIAGLELARDGTVLLEQEAPFAPIRLRCCAEAACERVSQAAAQRDGARVHQENAEDAGG
jgi:segregation and condensation protein A